jgi:hypothetical protein
VVPGAAGIRIERAAIDVDHALAVCGQAGHHPAEVSGPIRHLRGMARRHVDHEQFPVTIGIAAEIDRRLECYAAPIDRHRRKGEASVGYRNHTVGSSLDIKKMQFPSGRSNVGEAAAIAAERG